MKYKKQKLETMEDKEIFSLIDKKMGAANKISIAIFLAMLTFIVVLFNFTNINSEQHSAIGKELVAEQMKSMKEREYTHNIYKYVIDPNDSVVKILIIKAADIDLKVEKNMNIIKEHETRIHRLEDWTKKK